MSQERHQLDQHQERAAQAGAIRALKAPPPSFIMRSIPWWYDVSDIVIGCAFASGTQLLEMHVCVFATDMALCMLRIREGCRI